MTGPLGAQADGPEAGQGLKQQQKDLHLYGPVAVAILVENGCHTRVFEVCVRVKDRIRYA